MRKLSILYLVSSVAIYALAPMGATHADTETKKTPDTSSSGTKDPAGEKDMPMGMMMQGMGMNMSPEKMKKHHEMMMNMSPEEMKKHHEMMMEHHKMMMNMGPEEMKKHREMMMKEHQGMMDSDEKNT